MALSRDWEIRIDAWLKTLRERVTHPLAELPTGYAVTLDHLPTEQARRLRFRPIHAGRRWGAKWQYGWFRTVARLPAGAAAGSVVLMGKPAPESVVFVDGRAAGGLDRWHDEIPLPQLGKGPVEVMIESYAGHGPSPVYTPFLRPGQQVLPDCPPAQQAFGGLWLHQWNEPAYQLWLDASTLRRLIRCVPADSLRQHRLERALREVSCLVDVEAEQDQFDRQVPRGREFLAALLSCRNAPTMPRMYCFGHAHIDLAWLWPLQQTYRKAAATFSTVLTLMRRYPEYRFLQSQAQVYEFVRRHYPDLFGRIKQAARRGQWLAEGGMWVEADTNVSGGEALIRQFLYGREYFKDQFGLDSRVCWLPDVFGYSANLPQILRGCGLKYFTTQKIYWNYHGGTTFPYETFLWEGIDGSTVLAHMHRDYNAETHPEAVHARWQRCVHKDACDRFLFPFGWGDGGGGPTRDHLEYLRREGDLEGLPRTKFASPREFFADLEKAGEPKDRYVGELYLEVHRGTYTSQSHTKRFNRKGELALREVELWSAAAAALRGYRYPHRRIEQAWKRLLLNQFHDILPGSSIGRVYQEAEQQYRLLLGECDDLLGRARKRLGTGGGGWTVWNSLSWPRDVVAAIPLSSGRAGLADDKGKPLPTQWVGRGKARRLLAVVPGVPAFGCKAIARSGGPGAKCPSPVRARATGAGIVMENEFLLLRIDRRGEIAELYDKQADRQVVPRGQTMNRLEFYRDNPAAWDAWDIDISYKSTPVSLPPAEGVALTAAGPLEARVAVRRRLGGSVLRQEVVLRHASRRIDFPTRVDWRETHRLLKVAFPADLKAPVLRGEIQFGHVVRPTHRNYEFERQRFEWPAQKWADASEANFGVALMNDCKYGYDFLEGVLRLTLLRAPILPDPTADRRRHEFVYALYVHDGGFAESEVVRQGYDLNLPAVVTPGSAGATAFAEVSARAVICETVKRSQDDRATVLRLYESLGGSARTSLRCPAAGGRAWECDMLEAPLRRLAVGRGGEITLRFRPFEVKTIRWE